jgi:hypothetical protein
MTFDYQELDNGRLTEAGANRKCLSCGSSDVKFVDKAFGLVEVADHGQVDFSAHTGAMLMTYCGARVCEACGFVHLYQVGRLTE